MGFEAALDRLVRLELQRAGGSGDTVSALAALADDVASLRSATRQRVEIIGEHSARPQPEAPLVSVLAVFAGAPGEWEAYHRSVTGDDAVRGAELLYVVSTAGDRDEWFRAFRSVEEQGGQPFRAVVCSGPTLSGHALNIAARRSSGQYLAFLTNGAVPASRRWLSRSWLDLMIGALASNPARGLVGGRTLGPDGRVQDAGIMFTRRESVPEWLPVVRGWGSGREDDTLGQVTMPAVGPFGMMVTRDMLEQVGGWSEDYWFPALAGIDLCNRVWRSGKEVWYQRSVETANPGLPVAMIPIGDVAWLHDATRFSSMWGDWLWERYASPDDLLQASIERYYSGDRAAGSRACDRLLSHPQASPQAIEQTRRNLLFYSDPLFEQVDATEWSDAELPVDVPGGVANGSMLIEGDRVHILAIGGRRDPGVDGIVADLSVFEAGANAADLARLGGARLGLDGLGGETVARLAERRADVWLRAARATGATAVVIDRPGVDRSIASEVEFNLSDEPGWAVRAIDDVSTPGHAAWIPVPAVDRDRFLFRYRPTLVSSGPVEGPLRLEAAWQSPGLTAFFDAAVPLVRDGGALLTIVTQRVRDADQDVATHRVIEMDEACRITAISPAFCMRERGDERIAGLGLIEDRVLVAYLTSDGRVRLASGPISDLRSLLVPAQAFEHPGVVVDIDWGLAPDVVEKWTRVTGLQGSTEFESARSGLPEAGPSAKAGLDELGLMAGTDKSSMNHNYLVHFEQAFRRWKDEPIDVLEIGVAGGKSIRTWSDWFGRARIVGLDIAQILAGPIPERAEIRIGSQADERLLRRLAEDYRFLIVVDDGSHLWEHQKLTFEILFPLLPKGSIYVCEDVETSFAPLDVAFRDETEESPADYFLKLARSVAASEYSRVRRVPDHPFSEILPLVKRIDFVRHAVIVHRQD